MRLARIRHLPVLRDDRVVGILSNRDLMVAALSKVLKFGDAERRAFLSAVEVGEIMTPDPVGIAPEATLSQAASRLVELRIGCLLVNDEEGATLGILTETDLLRAVADSGAGPDA